MRGGETIAVKDFAEFGRRVRLIRQRHNWSIIDLEQRTGIAKGALSEIERAKSYTKYPRTCVMPGTLTAIARALDCEPKLLLGDDAYCDHPVIRMGPDGKVVICEVCDAIVAEVA